MKDKIKNLGFGYNHIAIIAVVVFAFSFYALPQLGINIKSMFAKADESKKLLTYDDVRTEVYASLEGATRINSDKANEQLALLDRGGLDNQVLGEMIGIGEIPSPEEMVLPEMAQRFPVKVSPDNSAAAKLRYKELTSGLESKYDVLNLMANLNSSDTELHKQSISDWGKLLKDLSAVVAPVELKSYHISKIGYYYSMMKTAEVYAGLIPESELPLYVKAMLSYTSSKQGGMNE